MSGAPPLLGSTGSTTIVLATILVLVGIAMVCVAVWLVRATRTDSRSLGPLEVMGDRSWRRRDAEARARSLDAARPDGAPPPAPMLARDPADPPPMVIVGVAESSESTDSTESSESTEPTDEAPDHNVEPVADDADRATDVPELADDDEANAATPDVTRVDEPQPADRS